MGVAGWRRRFHAKQTPPSYRPRSRAIPREISVQSGDLDFGATGENLAWPGDDVISAKNQHHLRMRQVSKNTHTNFLRDRTISIFGAAGENWAWQGDDVISAKNQHRHRVGQGRKLTRAKFQGNRTISIFRAWSNFWAWQADDVISAKNQHHHRVRHGPNHTRTKFQPNPSTLIFDQKSQWAWSLGRGHGRGHLSRDIFWHSTHSRHSRDCYHKRTIDHCLRTIAYCFQNNGSENCTRMNLFPLLMRSWLDENIVCLIIDTTDTERF